MSTPLLFTVGTSNLGKALIARSELGLSAVLLGDSVAEVIENAHQRFGDKYLTRDDDTLKPICTQVISHLNNPQQSPSFGLDLYGTEFQVSVWKALQSIPIGSTITYGQLAIRLGRPTAVRAVASACGANPVAVVIPCHRVICSDGSLGGYRWGLERKRQLLALEKEIFIARRQLDTSDFTNT